VDTTKRALAQCFGRRWTRRDSGELTRAPLARHHRNSLRIGPLLPATVEWPWKCLPSGSFHHLVARFVHMSTNLSHPKQSTARATVRSPVSDDQILPREPSIPLLESENEPGASTVRELGVRPARFSCVSARHDPAPRATSSPVGAPLLVPYWIGRAPLAHVRHRLGQDWGHKSIYHRVS
jgi:hypothetical protein